MKTKVADLLDDGLFGPFKTTGGGGGVASMVQVRHVTGPTLPAKSFARTQKVCAPSERAPKVIGELHACHGPPSRLHSRVTSPPLVEKVNVALRELMSPVGPLVIVTDGGGPEMFQLRHVPGPTLPARSIALTQNVCNP